MQGKAIKQDALKRGESEDLHFKNFPPRSRNSRKRKQNKVEKEKICVAGLGLNLEVCELPRVLKSCGCSRPMD